MACTGQGASRQGVAVLPRTLPPTPAWAKEVVVQRPPAGTDYRIISQTEKGGREANSHKLRCLVAWIDERRVEMAGGKPVKARGCPQG